MGHKGSVFVCHVREQKNIAELIFQKLGDSGIEVLFDRDQVDDGSRPDGPLKELVERADLFVFLLTQDSLDPNRYVHTEVAWRKHSHPIARKNNLLVAEWPNLDRSTQQLDPYLDVLVKLEVKGHYAAHIAQAIEDRFKERAGGIWGVWQTVRNHWRVAAIVFVAVIVASAYFSSNSDTTDHRPITVERSPDFKSLPIPSSELYAKIGNLEGANWTERLVSVLGEDDRATIKRNDWVIVNEWIKTRSGLPDQTEQGLIPATEIGRLSPGDVVHVRSVHAAPLANGVEHFWFSFKQYEERTPLFRVGEESIELVVPKRDLARKPVLRIAAFARVSDTVKEQFAVLGITLEQVKTDGNIKSLALHELSTIPASPRFIKNKTVQRSDQHDFGKSFAIAVEVAPGEEAVFRLSLIQGILGDDGRYRFYPLTAKLDNVQTEMVVEGEYVSIPYQGHMESGENPDPRGTAT